MVLSPVVSDEQHPQQLLRVRPTESQHPKTLRTNDQVLTLDAGTTFHQQFMLTTDCGGQGSESPQLHPKPLCSQGFSHVPGRVIARHVIHLSVKIAVREALERPPLRYGVILAGTARHDAIWHHGNAVGAQGSSASLSELASGLKDNLRFGWLSSQLAFALEMGR